jgi:glycosyltransferase involved in cell wall biosynthesis
VHFKKHAAISRDKFLGEIIVADNGGTDGSIEITESLGARAVTLPQRGYGNALCSVRHFSEQ